jgi:hypothetical protein
LRIRPAHGRLDSAGWNLGRQTKIRFWELLACNVGNSCAPPVLAVAPL